MSHIDSQPRLAAAYNPWRRQYAGDPDSALVRALHRRDRTMQKIAALQAAGPLDSRIEMLYDILAEDEAEIEELRKRVSPR
jgi:hypothetical protein